MGSHTDIPDASSLRGELDSHLTNTSGPLTLLLGLQEVTVIQTKEGEEKTLGTGNLNITPLSNESCTLTVIDDTGNTLFTTPLGRTTAVKSEANNFMFPVSGGLVNKITLDKQRIVDIEMLEDLLTHFTPYQTRLKLRKTLAVVDARGEVTHIVAGEISLQDDPNADEKSDVVVDLHEEDFTIIKVRAIAEKNESYIVAGSEFLAKGFVSGATILARGITITSNYAARNLTPAAPINLSDKTKRTLDKARQYSDQVAQGASMVIDNAMNGLITAGKTVTSAISPPQALTTTSTGTDRFAAVKRLGGNAVHAAGTLIGGVEEGISILGESVISGVSSAVNTKYGPDASHLLLATTAIGVDTAKTIVYFDSRGISRRVLVRKAGEAALKRVLKDQEAKGEKNDRGKDEVLFEAPQA